ncbi:aspartic peptidase A1 [Multifurca ochricompacta]|uniref:Aspartic peptidase A1 n=1 Tax=Multifurca ochricompacta TaxID=376703 RepID=A0AAD4M2Q1_9AGAM|nr:aspartic peptidase A1 [Multifurca ochricompacta]
MFPTASLTAFLLLAVSVSANPIVVRNPPVSLSFARHLNITGSFDLVAKDQARAKNFMAIGKAKHSGTLSTAAVVSVGVTNVAVVYQATVGVGSPATNYNLLIDTGSSNTWVGAGKTYVKTSTSVQTSNRVSVTYGSGSFSGTEFTDTVTIGPGLVVPGQSIGVASTSTGFTGFDGILGIGPTDLTLGTLSPNTGSSIPTVTDNLFRRGTITSNLVSVSFEPTTTTSVKNGELTFGGTDSTKFTGSLTFIPITSTSPANQFWGINESIRYGTSTSILTTTAGIVDTGTTLILIATDAFNRYTTATGAVLDATTGLLRITSAQFTNLKSLFFTTGGRSFELTANAQLWPRALNTFIGGTSGNIYLVVNDIGTPTGQGLDFINGFTFLERFYSVFDTGNKRVGFATTSFTTATSN